MIKHGQGKAGMVTGETGLGNKVGRGKLSRDPEVVWPNNAKLKIAPGVIDGAAEQRKGMRPHGDAPSC